MNIRRICALYFSPTGGTEKIARFVTEELARHLGGEPAYVDFTRPETGSLNTALRRTTCW